MDSPEALDVSKENIQPLRQGRIASQLTAALQAQTDTTILQNLVKKRQEYELLLRTYDGDDPLSIWFEYIEWVEQSFPKDGKEGNLMTLLQNCLTRFKDSTKYFQDIRLVKLWIKYMEKLENPLELYSQLHCHGIGSQCALFYRCWADELYESGDVKQADKVLRMAIGRNAQPIDELKRAHENFQITVARRVMEKSLPASEENTVVEERKVGNVLTTFGKKHKVPSVRIGGRVKSSFPGTLPSKENMMPQRNVDPVSIFEAENDLEIARSVNKMQTVPHLEILKKENTKKPIPWSGVKQKSAFQFHPPKPSFQVHTDENAQPEPINSVMFLNALKPKKDDGFNCPVAIFEVPNPNQQPMYPKDQVYAGGTEYSLEELRAVKYMKHREKRSKERLVPDSQNAVPEETTLCTSTHTVELEKLNPMTPCVSNHISVTTSQKDSNLCSYIENDKFNHNQQLSVSGNNYEKCIQAHTSSTTGSDCFLGDRKLPDRPSVHNTQYQHCVEDHNYTNSATIHLSEMDDLSSFVRCTEFTPTESCTVNGSCVPENVKHADVHCSENTGTLLSAKENSCRPALLLAENEQQKLNNQGTIMVKASGFSVLTTGDVIDSPETVQAGISFNSLNKGEMPYSENGHSVSSSNTQSSVTSVLVAEDQQQKQINCATFSLKSSGFSVFSTGQDVGAPDTVKAGEFFTSLNKEDMPFSENAEITTSKESSCKSAGFLAENEQPKLNNQSAFPLKECSFSVHTEGSRKCSPETVKAGDFLTSLNKEEFPHSETDGIMSSNKPSSCMPTLFGAENNQQKQINYGKSSSVFQVFTTEDGLGTPETVKAGGFFTSLNKEDIPYSENADIMLASKSSSCKSSFLVAENKQQKLQNQETFSVKGSDFSVLATAHATGAPETVKTSDIFTCSRTEEIVSCSGHTNNVLLSNKVKGSGSPVMMQGNENKQNEEIHEGKISVNGNRILEFPIFSDEDNCYAKGQGGPKAGQENGFSSFPSKNKNLFSHSLICGPNKPLNDDVKLCSSTTKKNKVAPFQLFVDDSEVPKDHEPCATKRELFSEVAREPYQKLCNIDSKENMTLPSLCTLANRPITEKREIKGCDNIVTASMLKLRHKKATEQIKEPAAEEREKVIPATVVPKKSEGCVPSSISASSEDLLDVINECWASPQKNRWDAGNVLCPEPHKEPEDRVFQHGTPLKLPALFPENKENALPLCPKQNVLEPPNTPVNDDWYFGHMGEPKALDDTCCTLMFSKTLISSTPNRKSGGPVCSDSSDNSPPDSQEFKIPRGYTTTYPAERFPIIPRPDVLSVIMESSKENKSQSSSGSSTGGRTTHHTAFSLVSPQTENTHSALETQPPCEAHAVIMTRSPLLHDEGDSSI